GQSFLCDPRRRGPLAAYPEARADRRCALCCQSPLLPYLALLQVGFAMPALLPRPRCALTAPFHPYRLPRPEPRELRRSALCCTFRGLTPPRRYLAPDPPEPGLSSPPTCVGAAIARPASIVIMTHKIAGSDFERLAKPSGPGGPRPRMGPSKVACGAFNWRKVGILPLCASPPLDFIDLAAPGAARGRLVNRFRAPEERGSGAGSGRRPPRGWRRSAGRLWRRPSRGRALWRAGQWPGAEGRCRHLQPRARRLRRRS